MSLDFGANFDVDAFLFHEDQLRSHATIVGPDPGYGHLQDPLLGCLPSGTRPRLTNGADHLAVYEKFIRDHIQPDAYVRIVGTPRRLTMFNLSVSNQGDARGVIDALVGFRLQNLDAEMSIVASKLGPSEFQETLEFCKYLEILADNDIHVDMFASTDCPTRQVMHAKGIVIDSQVLFSTGAVMDTKPINKADFSIELPRAAATTFQHYTDERRAELAAELAKLGVVVNDPVTGLTYISRAQDALIRGATHQLIVSLSELVDPAMTQALIDRAAGGVQVIIQVRELDPVSAMSLAGAMLRGSNLVVENSSWWEPRPHFNAIIADGDFAYLGTSYLWPTQRNMVHHSRSLENGVLLHGDAAASVLVQIEDLRARAHGFATVSCPRKQKALDLPVLNRCGPPQAALAAVQH
ncbi:hypothetical protein P170DRAFT_349816 [Aspergillus steynii IBT 23096]|uniref:Uncharacterized protein n=1 Tax=Aspergillus steynii IBT 23096 TaxID=1392250 RepID=A0A2I2GK66_9EURO|nr:uncharacterized protein P170DRAFT_349816 [Aspergillus steynii IBT 23096]PLB53270.1 hypothetical protein P170DRAFT_349816 [Aspergillus steynii IBT 23096]